MKKALFFLAVAAVAAIIVAAELELKRFEETIGDGLNWD